MSHSGSDESVARIPDGASAGGHAEHDVSVRYPQLSCLIGSDVSDLDGQRNSIAQLRRVLADMQGSLDGESIE